MKQPIYPIKTLENSLSVLEALSQSNSSMSIREISEKLQIYPSSVHRILDTLRHRGYVEQDPDTQRYQLGLKLVELGMSKLYQVDLIKETTPYLKELVAQYNETTYLGVLVGREVLVVAREDCTRNIRMVSEIGKRVPAHCTALGKVLLAYLPREQRKKILEGRKLSQFTKNTITSKRELEKELKKVREQGFAVDRGEYEDELHCVGAPIRNYQEKVVGAISIAGPAFRMDVDKRDDLKKALIQTAREISKRLGYIEKPVGKIKKKRIPCQNQRKL